MESDRPAWVRKDVFLVQFDQYDFHFRDVQRVQHAYLADWFSVETGELRFILPAFGIIKRQTQFINGRHRVAVLLNYMELLPMAFARGMQILSEEEDWEREALLSRLAERPLLPSEYINLPKFPIVDKFVSS